MRSTSRRRSGWQSAPTSSRRSTLASRPWRSSRRSGGRSTRRPTSSPARSPHTRRTGTATYSRGSARSRCGASRRRSIARFRADLEADGVGAETIRRTMTIAAGHARPGGRVAAHREQPVKAVRKPPSRRKHAVQGGGAGAGRAPALATARRRPVGASRADQRPRLRRCTARGGTRGRVAPRPRPHAARGAGKEKASTARSSPGQKNGRPPRTVELLDALRHDLKELNLRAGRPADGEAPLPHTARRTVA